MSLSKEIKDGLKYTKKVNDLIILNIYLFKNWLFAKIKGFKSLKFIVKS